MAFGEWEEVGNKVSTGGKVSPPGSRNVPAGQRLNPFHLFDEAARRVSSASMQAFTPKPINPMDPFGITSKAAQTLNQLPHGSAEPALSLAGGVVGGIPGGVVGASMGKTLDMARQDDGVPFDPGRASNAVREVASSGGRAAALGLLGGTAAKTVHHGIMKTLPVISKTPLGRTATSSLAGAAAGGATADSWEDVPQAAMTGAALGAGVQGIAEKLNPVQQRGLMTPEKLQPKMSEPRRGRYFEKQRTRLEKSTQRQVEPLNQQEGFQLDEADARLTTQQQAINARLSKQQEALSSYQTRAKDEAAAKATAATKRAAEQRQARIQQLDKERQALDAELESSSKAKTIFGREPFLKKMASMRKGYQEGVDQAIKKADAAGVTLADDEVRFALQKQFEREPEMAGQLLGHLGIDAPTANVPAVKKSFSPKQILEAADQLGQGVSRPVTPTRAFSRQDMMRDKARTALLDLLDSKGVEGIKEQKAIWRGYVKTRDRGVKLLGVFDDPDVPSMTGARALQQVAKGKGPVEVVAKIEKAAGVNLTDDLKAIVGRMDKNTQAKLMADVEADAAKQQALLTRSRRDEDVTSVVQHSQTRVAQEAETARQHAQNTRSRQNEDVKAFFQGKRQAIEKDREGQLRKLGQQEDTIKQQAARRRAIRRRILYAAGFAASSAAGTALHRLFQRGGD